MRVACEQCQRRPTGVEGHEGLSLVATPKAGPVFICARCKMSWLRSYEGAGVFVWVEYSSIEEDGEGNG